MFAAGERTVNLSVAAWRVVAKEAAWALMPHASQPAALWLGQQLCEDASLAAWVIVSMADRICGVLVTEDVRDCGVAALEEVLWR